MKIIAALLERGDVFLQQGTNYVVLAVLSDVVIYRSRGFQDGGGGVSHEMGINSKAKIVLVEDCHVGKVSNLHKFMTGENIKLPKPKRKTKPHKRIAEYGKMRKLNKRYTPLY